MGAAEIRLGRCSCGLLAAKDRLSHGLGNRLLGLHGGLLESRLRDGLFRLGSWLHYGLGGLGLKDSKLCSAVSTERATRLGSGAAVRTEAAHDILVIHCSSLPCSRSAPRIQSPWLNGRPTFLIRTDYIKTNSHFGSHHGFPPSPYPPLLGQPCAHLLILYREKDVCPQGKIPASPTTALFNALLMAIA